MSGVDDEAWNVQTAVAIAGLAGVNCASDLAAALASEGSYLSAWDRDDLAQWLLLEILENGAAGNPLDLAALKRMIHRLRQRIYRRSRREVPLDQSLIDSVPDPSPTANTVGPDLSRLTEEELVIVSLWMEGMPPRAIANALGISAATLYRRLESIRNAVAHGLA
jgi:DNA-binding CsgD family transcriptional regulator